MKRCPNCKQLKSESDFYKNAHMKDGLSVHCKNCQNQYIYQSAKNHRIKTKQEETQKQLDDFNFHLGGYRITIINYAKKGEYKFNIIPTNGKPFGTNNKNEFVDYITRNC